VTGLSGSGELVGPAGATCWLVLAFQKDMLSELLAASVRPPNCLPGQSRSRRKRVCLQWFIV